MTPPEKLSVFCMLAVVVLVFSTTSQAAGLQPNFGQALLEVRQAEAAGATKSELSNLITLLNKALELDIEALKLNAPNQVEKRVELLAEVDQILLTFESQAAALTVMSSHRTFVGRVFGYVWGAVAAVLLTVTYALGTSIREKYRVKRTLQMRVSLP